MDLKYYLSILWANKWIIITTFVITVIVVIVGTILITPIYSSSTTLRVATASTSSISYTDYVYADRLMNTYTKIATSRPVLDELASKLNLQTRPEIKVSTIPSTELIKIIVNSPDPQVAQNAANTLAEILIVKSQELYSGGEKSTTEILNEQLQIAEGELNQARSDYDALVNETPDDNESIAKASLVVDFKQKTYETLLEQFEAARVREALRANTVTVIEPAVMPQKPSQPNIFLNIALGVIVGLVGGIGLVFLFENLNPRLYTIDQIESVTDLAIIGKVPSIRARGLSGLGKKKLKTNDPAFKESFHKLQTKINQENINDQPINSLLITSAVPGEGKSTILSNLALAMGKAGQKVIIVDCDMRIPTQHKIFGLSNKLGLSSVLNKQLVLVDVVQKSQNPNTWVITSGPIPPNPIELLASPQMKTMIELLKQKFSYVLIDTPALLPVGDAIVISTLVDAMVLVVKQNHTKEDTLQEACKLLSDLNTRTIGVVVNEAKQNGTHYYYSAKYP